jgi:hypothetical protein
VKEALVFATKPAHTLTAVNQSQKTSAHSLIVNAFLYVPGNPGKFLYPEDTMKETNKPDSHRPTIDGKVQGLK